MEDSISFEWNEEKNEINKRKHNVSFEEAVTVFYDTEARVVFDEEHSYDEDRFVILGQSRALRLLVVCHCYKKTRGKDKDNLSKKSNRHGNKTIQESQGVSSER